ncbi:MAG: hypothetical protein DMF54_11265 [Acidobacteria bacterium]|nr:MAG: hypothetical protein DMF54_11265 [Acidobacteriota bacterium]
MPEGRFQDPSGNWTRETFGWTARIRPSRSSCPVRETPPPIETSSAERNGSGPSRGSLPIRTSASLTDGGRNRNSTCRKVTGRPSAAEIRVCETP